ncbi:hypothetical protein MHU86_900 [Fragilaria crotonensis]|nr:hypothetical protein MHU86_900 [Fragilaria crotonensis]
MMKIAVLLMAIIAAITVHPSQGAVACFYHWTRGQAGTSGSKTFTGITNSTTTPKKELYNNPLYYSLAAAKTGFTSTNLAKGRLSGSLLMSTYVGTMTFDFFKGGDQIVTTFTKSTGKAVIKSGKGCYAGITGSGLRTLKSGITLPKYFEWKFCPAKAPSCTPK